MTPIDPTPQSGASPQMTFERPGTTAAARPQPLAMPVPAAAGGTPAAGPGDYIALGVGLAAVGALGLAAAEAAGATEGLAVGGAALLKNAATAAKAFGPRLAEHWKEGADQMKDAASFGRFAADQATAAAGDLARTAAIGGGLSAGAAIARHVAHAASHAPAVSPAAERLVQRSAPDR